MERLKKAAVQAGRGPKALSISVFAAPADQDKFAPYREAGIDRVLFEVPDLGRAEINGVGGAVFRYMSLGSANINRIASSLSLCGSKVPRLATLSTMRARRIRAASIASARALTPGQIAAQSWSPRLMSRTAAVTLKRSTDWIASCDLFAQTT